MIHFQIKLVLCCSRNIFSFYTKSFGEKLSMWSDQTQMYPENLAPAPFLAYIHHQLTSNWVDQSNWWYIPLVQDYSLMLMIFKK